MDLDRSAAARKKQIKKADVQASLFVSYRPFFLRHAESNYIPDGTPGLLNIGAKGWGGSKTTWGNNFLCGCEWMCVNNFFFYPSPVFSFLRDW